MPTEYSQRDDDHGDVEGVDLDLDAREKELRDEAVGEPVTIRIDGVVIHIRHPAEWPMEATRAIGRGDFDAWAEEVIDDEDELKAFDDANLEQWQLEAIFEEAGKKNSPGKSRKQGRSSRRSLRR